ncbi:MAG: hypothetical protein WAK48_24945, partial [Candidatus Acidiferrum sp.]
VSPRVDGAEDANTKMYLGPERFRPLITGETRVIAAGGYKPSDAESLVDRGIADAVAFGRLFISNPDLPKRIELDAPLNAYDRKLFTRAEPRAISITPLSMRRNICSW